MQEEVGDEMTRESILESMGGNAAGVDFVKYSRGLQEGWLRYKHADAVESMLSEVGESKEKDISTTAFFMHVQQTFLCRIDEKLL